MTIQIFTFLFFFAAALFVLGNLGLSLAKWEASLTRAMSFGLVMALGVFQLMAYPLFKADASFSALFWSYSAVMAVLLLWGLFRLTVKKEICFYGRYLREMTQKVRQTPLLHGLVLGLMGLYLVLAVFFSYETSDDGYYIPRALEVLANDRLAISHSLAWVGREVAAWPPNSDPSTLEFFKAYLSACSGLHVQVLCRNALNIAFSLISLAAMYDLAGDLSGDREETPRVQALFLVFYCILLLARSYTNDTNAFWTLRYIWQGKAMLCGIVFPMIMSGCYRIVQRGQNPIPGRDWVVMAALLLAGISVSIVGAFLPFIFYFTLGLPYLVTSKWENAKKMLLPIVLSALPVIVFSGLTFLEVMTRNTIYLSRFQMPDWWETFRKSFAQGHYISFFLYVGSVIYICRRGSRPMKLLLVVPPVLLFATFLNPLLTGLVSKYVTTASVYWRLYWLLPVTILPAYAAADALGSRPLEQVKTTLRTAVATVALLLGMGMTPSGPQAYLEGVVQSYCEKSRTPVRTNMYNLDHQVIQVMDKVWLDHGEEKVTILTDFSYLMESQLRQYSADIVLAGVVRPETLSYLTMPVEGTDVTQGTFYEAFFDGQVTDAGYLWDMLSRMGVEYICLWDVSIMPEGTEEAGIHRMDTIGEYTLYKVLY